MAQQKPNLEKIITGIILFWIFFPAICIIGINSKPLLILHPLLLDLTICLGYILLFLSFMIFHENKEKLQIKQNLPYFLLLAMLAWTFISAVFSQNPQTAFYGSTRRTEGALMYLAYAGFFCGSLSLRNDKYKKIIFNTFLCVAIFQSLCCFLEFLKFDILTASYFSDEHLSIRGWIWAGIYNNPNHFGYYLTMAIIYAGYNFVLSNKKSKWFYLLSYLFLVATLIFNDTLGCFIAVVSTLIIGTIILYIKDSKTLVKNLILIFTLIVITISITITAHNGIFKSLIRTANEIENIAQGEIPIKAGSGRMELWLAALQFTKERPLVGYGPDNLGDEYKKLEISQDRPHNEYLQYMASCGIPALIFYVSALALIYIRRLKQLKKLSNLQLIFMAVSGSYLISAFFGNTLYYTSPYFWLALALI